MSPPPPHTPRTKWTRRVLHPVLIGHAASLSQVEALVKHLEELSICANKCHADGASVVAMEAELTALRHCLDACKRDKKDELLLPRHVKPPHTHTTSY